MWTLHVQSQVRGQCIHQHAASITAAIDHAAISVCVCVRKGACVLICVWWGADAAADGEGLCRFSWHHNLTWKARLPYAKLKQGRKSVTKANSVQNETAQLDFKDGRWQLLKWMTCVFNFCNQLSLFMSFWVYEIAFAFQLQVVFIWAAHVSNLSCCVASFSFISKNI